MTPPVSEFGQLTCSGMFAFAGVGDEAEEIDSSLRHFHEEVFQGSISLAEPSADLLSDLLELKEECSSPNWDGYGALPLQPLVLAKAKVFLKALPVAFSRLELSATPQGDVALDWYYAKRHSLTLLIGEQSRVVYAVIDGDEEYSGTATFAEKVPPSILRALKRLSTYSAV